MPFASGMFTRSSVADTVSCFVGFGSMAHVRDTQIAHAIVNRSAPRYIFGGGGY